MEGVLLDSLRLVSSSSIRCLLHFVQRVNPIVVEGWGVLAHEQSGPIDVGRILHEVLEGLIFASLRLSSIFAELIREALARLFWPLLVGNHEPEVILLYVVDPVP